jgi:F-type H+-transporting ATPase subunit a
LRTVFVVLVESLAGIAEDRLGPDWRRYFPIVASIFFFILFANLMGLLPGVGGATADANTTWAWAIIAWLVYTIVGVMKHKQKYLVKFMGPSFFEREMFGRKVHFRMLMPFFLILEIPLDLARIGTLAVRLLANMYADHVVIGIWIALVPIGIPAIFMGLGLMIACLQAFVFALLTMIYIGLALDEPH